MQGKALRNLVKVLEEERQQLLQKGCSKVPLLASTDFPECTHTAHVEIPVPVPSDSKDRAEMPHSVICIELLLCCDGTGRKKVHVILRESLGTKERSPKEP